MQTRVRFWHSIASCRSLGVESAQQSSKDECCQTKRKGETKV